MYFSADIRAIATTEMHSQLPDRGRQVAPEPIRVRTPQRKANYKNKARLRLKDLKQIAQSAYKCRDSGKIKEYLKFLGIKLDLRLTSAWDALIFELWHEMLAAKAILEAISPQPQQILAAAFTDAIARNEWSPVKVALNEYAEYKDEASELLSTAEKKQISVLVSTAIKLLRAAVKSGTIASFKEDEEGDMFWIWQHQDAKPELVTSTYLKTFLENIEWGLL